MKNMPQNGQKRQKVQKPKKCTNENWPIFIPCDVDDHFWWSKQAKNTQKQPYLVGLSENRWKNTKNAISQKGLAKRFWKLVKFMSYMCTLRIKSKQTSCKEVRLDVVWGKCVVGCLKCKTIVTQESLLELEPMVGFGRYMTRIQTPNNSGIFSITNSHDLCLAAYSRWGKNNWGLVSPVQFLAFLPQW